MRIWQRILLITLAIAMSVMLVEFITVNSDFEKELEKETKESLYLHEQTLHSIQRRRNNTKLLYGIDTLEEYMYEDIISDALYEQQNTGTGIRIITENDYTATNYRYYSNIKSSDMKVTSVKNPKHQIVKRGERYFLIMDSINTVEYLDFTITTQKDITHLYDVYYTQVKAIKNTGIVLLGEAGLIMIIVLTSLLVPLKKIQKGIKEITEGNYGKQIAHKGDNELSDLSKDINIMSLTIAENISEMEEMLENRRVFIGNMAHEMKTPLTAILGFADILTIKTDLTYEQKIEYSEQIYREALRLRAMSGKLMELMQLQANTLRAEVIDFREFMQEIVDTETVILANKSIKIISDLCEAKIFADPDLLKSLFFNIMDNAYKATEESGKIEVHTKVIEDNVEIKVIDYGIGIPEGDVKKVVEPFYMVDKSRTRKDGGAGLGLALCQQIVDINNGQMSIESSEGKGSTVIVKLPIYDNE